MKYEFEWGYVYLGIRWILGEKVKRRGRVGI
jgi:hypothetical protein